MASFATRIKNAWNAFRDRDPTSDQYAESPPYNGGYYASSFGNPGRHALRTANARTIVSTIINRIAVDCSSMNIKHVRLREDGQYESTIDDPLNRVLTRSANIDQTGRAMILDLVSSMLDEGVVAVFPFDTECDPRNSDSYDIYGVKVGKICEWYPKHIRIEVYNEITGQKVQMIVEKRICAIIENPFFSIMNAPNSTLRRLTNVLSQLDKTNQENSSGRLDMIIKLPYQIKNQAKKEQAETKRKEIEDQLSGDAKYGIAYIDATEQVIQLNRSLDNNLWEQANTLTKDLFNQMGLSMSLFDGTANESTMLNYYNQTITPILTAITEEMERKWLTKTAITQRQAIRFFRDPFKLVSVEQLAKVADTFTRNEILTSNEIRGIMGFIPSNDPKADRLENSNLNQKNNDSTPTNKTEEIQNKEES